MTSTPSKRGRKPGICLTPRDLAILKCVDPGGIIRLAEVHRVHFPGKPRRSAWHRMKKLTTAGLLVECRGDRRCLLGWYLPRSGIRAPVYRTNYDHDEQVREVLDLFEKSPSFRSFRPAHALTSLMMKGSWRQNQSTREEMFRGIPDALIDVQVQGQRAVIALEVELTRKTKARLGKKFESLLLDSRWDWVFFVVQGPVLMNLIVQMEAWIAKSSYRVKLAQRINGIYFCELKTLLEQGVDATWRSRNQSLKLKDLRP